MSTALSRPTVQGVMGALRAHGVDYVERYRGKRNGATVKAGAEVNQIGRFVVVDYSPLHKAEPSGYRAEREATLAASGEALDAAGFVWQVKAGMLVVAAKRGA